MTTVVLLPGMDGSGALFEEFSSALAARTMAISYPPDQPLGYDQLAEYVRARLPADEPFILLGESFSGPIALTLASTPLPGLRALVLVCTFAKCPVPGLLALAGRLIGLLPFWRAPLSLVSTLLLGRFANSTLQARLSAAIERVSPVVWSCRLRAVLTADATQALAKVRVPILYLRASEDRVVFPSASEVVLRRSSVARMVEIEGPHFLLQAKPKETAAEIRAFAEELGLGFSEAPTVNSEQ